MTIQRRPRAFVSYRHLEHTGGADVEALNREHRYWVEKLARDLRRWNVEVVYDADIRLLFRPHVKGDPELLPFLAEVSIIASLVCHAFLPILTLSYVERLGYADYSNQREAPFGFVFEEWQISMLQVNDGRMDYIPIIRGGEPERIAELPLGVSPHNAFDMRDGRHYEQQVEFIADRLHLGWSTEHPPVNMTIAEWISTYIAWCRNNWPGCAEPNFDAWTADLLRPRKFLEFVSQADRP